MTFPDCIYLSPNWVKLPNTVLSPLWFLLAINVKLCLEVLVKMETGLSLDRSKRWPKIEK